MKKDDIYRSQFRLPYSLYEKLKESAEANNRSVNAELVARLEDSYNSPNILDVSEENKKLYLALEKNTAAHKELKEFMEQLTDVLSNPQ